MDVTFTKVAGRRYLMTVVRERGPQLAPRHGPGYDDYLPHDAVHFIVEAEARLSGGVFGRVAAGWSNIFWAADPKMLRREGRREAKRRPSATERAQMARSEELAGVCQRLWELRAGHRRELPDWFASLTPDSLESPLHERILARLDEFAARWHALQVGSSITLTWPLDGQVIAAAAIDRQHARSITPDLATRWPGRRGAGRGDASRLAFATKKTGAAATCASAAMTGSSRRTASALYLAGAPDQGPVRGRAAISPTVRACSHRLRSGR
jgi:hypothetical protein